jgi:hypothetical protein
VVRPPLIDEKAADGMLCQRLISVETGSYLLATAVGAGVASGRVLGGAFTMVGSSNTGWRVDLVKRAGVLNATFSPGSRDLGVCPMSSLDRLGRAGAEGSWGAGVKGVASFGPTFDPPCVPKLEPGIEVAPEVPVPGFSGAGEPDRARWNPS